ncbi:MAG: hypothetical protein U1E45_14380 [Geminicoccaceae bacterium]
MDDKEIGEGQRIEGLVDLHQLRCAALAFNKTYTDDETTKREKLRSLEVMLFEFSKALGEMDPGCRWLLAEPIDELRLGLLAVKEQRRPPEFLIYTPLNNGPPAGPSRTTKKAACAAALEVLIGWGWREKHARAEIAMLISDEKPQSPTTWREAIKRRNSRVSSEERRKYDEYVRAFAPLAPHDVLLQLAGVLEAGG